MTINIDVINKEVKIAVSGSIYMEEAASIREKLIVYLEEGYKTFIINMGDVDYIDSSGLGVLVGIQKRALQQGGSVRVEDIRGLVKELFELTRLTKVFRIDS